MESIHSFVLWRLRPPPGQVRICSKMCGKSKVEYQPTWLCFAEVCIRGYTGLWGGGYVGVHGRGGGNPYVGGRLPIKVLDAGAPGA